MKKYLQKINYFWLVFYVLFFVILLQHSFSYMDNDLGWHLQAGKDVYLTEEVPHLNYSNYTLYGERWVDHEWLSNLMSYFIFAKFGYVTLNVFFALLFLATLWLLNNFVLQNYLKNKRDVFYLLIFDVIGYLGVMPHLGVRVQEFTMLFFVLFLIIIHKYNKTKNYYLLLWFPALMYFWVNLHGGFLLGMVLLFFWVGVKVLEIIFQKMPIFSFLKFDSVLSFKEIAIFFSIACLTVVPTFFTPYGLELYSFLGDYANTFYTKIIQEWLPIYFFPFEYWKFVYILLFVVLFFLALIFSWSKDFRKKYLQNKFDLWQLACVVVFLYMAFNTRRHFPLFFIVSFPVLVTYFNEHWPIKMDWLFDFAKNKLLISYLLLCSVLLFAILLLKTNFTNDPFSNKDFCRIFPCESVNFIKNNKELAGKKIFNDYGWGGYMIWTWPEKQLFIDGRLPQYKYGRHTILEEYDDFDVKEKLVNKLKEHEIELVHMKKGKLPKLDWLEKYIYTVSENDFKEKGDFEEYLDKAIDWKNVYEDEISKVYVKK